MHACIYELWKIVADGRDGDSKVLQEVLADLKSAKRHILWKYSQIEGEWSFYKENLNFYSKNLGMVRRPPPLLGNARIFPSCITAILPYFID